MSPKRIRKQGIKSKLHTFSNFFKMLPRVVQYTIARTQCELGLLGGDVIPQVTVTHGKTFLNTHTLNLVFCSADVCD